ncbi:hypothetical protein B0H11DRAFT_2228066 [Mycena galericulata]|nr:hypothetical protein B0H11DRAFT_2228066 [Mycena galericulata]
MPRADHRRIGRDFINSIVGGGGGSKSTGGTPPTSTGAAGGGDPPTTTTTSTTSTTSPTTTSTKQQQQHSDTETSTSTTSTTTSTATTTSTTSTKAQTTTSTTSAPPSTSVVVTPSSVSVANTKAATTTAKTTAAKTTTAAGALGTANNIQTTAAGTTISASSTAVAAASSLNVGAVVGGIAGGIAGIALIFFICMFFIVGLLFSQRTLDLFLDRSAGDVPVQTASTRSRSASQAVMVDDKADPFNPRPPTMIERKLNSHNVAPSISSMTGAGMAGAGAYSNHGHADEQQQYDDQYAQQQYAAAAAAAGHQPIQPRQQYTYGQSYQDEHDAYMQQQEQQHDAEYEYNGAYSADPQAQGIYAAEAYAYPGGEDQVVVSPGMHAQEMGHQQYGLQQQADAYGGM